MSEPKVGDWRMTVTVLASGQQRAYGDTIHTYRVFFEWVPYGNRKGYEPAKWSEDIVTRHLRAIYSWFEKGQGDWASARLDYIRQVAPGTWEFSVREAYTD